MYANEPWLPQQQRPPLKTGSVKLVNSHTSLQYSYSTSMFFNELKLYLMYVIMQATVTVWHLVSLHNLYYLATGRNRK